MTETTENLGTLDRGNIASGGGDKGECERSEHEKLEEFRGGASPSPVSIAYGSPL